MDIQHTSLSQACSGRKLIVNHSRLMKSIKPHLNKINYFNALFDVSLVRHIYDPFTLIIIMRSETSLKDC